MFMLSAFSQEHSKTSSFHAIGMFLLGCSEMSKQTPSSHIGCDHVGGSLKRQRSVWSVSECSTGCQALDVQKGNIMHAHLAPPCFGDGAACGI